jgi:hypothetical protein
MPDLNQNPRHTEFVFLSTTKIFFFIKKLFSNLWSTRERSSDIGEFGFFTLDYQRLTEGLLQTELMAHMESLNSRMKNFSGQSIFSLK